MAKKIDFTRVRYEARKGSKMAKKMKADRKASASGFNFGANVGRKRSGKGGGS